MFTCSSYVATLALFVGPAPVPPRAPVAASSARRGAASMCGLLASYNSKLSPEALRLQMLTLQRLVRHRGPDGSGIHVVPSPDGTCVSSVAHERLAIVDPLSGNQPLFSHDRKRSLSVNGEIYNHVALRQELRDQSEFATKSDVRLRPRPHNPARTHSNAARASALDQADAARYSRQEMKRSPPLHRSLS